MAEKPCPRCKLPRFYHQPHLCPDVMKRLARREREAQEVIDILAAMMPAEDTTRNEERRRATAVRIVSRLASLGVTE